MDNPFFLLSLFISSWLAFFTSAFLIELLFKIFKISHPRTRSFFRLFPYLSLGIDLSLSQYSLAHWINPLSCASCLQKWILGALFPDLQLMLREKEISLVNHLGHLHAHPFFTVLFALLLMVSFLLVARQFKGAFDCLRFFHQIGKKAKRLEYIGNKELEEALQTQNVKVYVSSEIDTPLAVYPKKIFLPEKIVRTFSALELEAILAHEWAHIRYKDALWHFMCVLAASFVWWVPTKWWLEKREEELEFSCDREALVYGIEKEDMASALYKAVGEKKQMQAICCFASKEPLALMRIREVLGLSKNKACATSLFLWSIGFGASLMAFCMYYF